MKDSQYGQNLHQFNHLPIHIINLHIIGVGTGGGGLAPHFFCKVIHYFILVFACQDFL